MHIIEVIIEFLCFIFIAMVIVLLIINLFLVVKPSDEQWERISKLKAFHYTTIENIEKINKGNGYIHLKSSKSLKSNYSSWFRNSVYFFIEDKNNNELKKMLNIKKNESIKLTVDISNLERHKIKVRNYDNVLIYKGDYIGKGEINK